MAFSLESLRSKILTSIHGRRLGIDANEFLVGPKGLRHQITNATSATTGTNLTNHGFHTVQSATGAKTWKLDDPVAGCEVTIGTKTASAQTQTVTTVAATIVSTQGVTGRSIVMRAAGSYIRLLGISTSQWLVAGISPNIVTTHGSTIHTGVTVSS